MGIYNKYGGLRGRLPLRTLEALIVQSTEPMWRRVIGANLTAAEIRERRQSSPLLKAELGAEAVRQASEKNDAALHHLGQAMVAKAVADAAAQPDDLITQAAVTEVAAGLPLGDMTGNPYVDPAVAARVTGVLGREAKGDAE